MSPPHHFSQFLSGYLPKVKINVGGEWVPALNSLADTCHHIVDGEPLYLITLNSLADTCIVNGKPYYYLVGDSQFLSGYLGRYLVDGRADPYSASQFLSGYLR